MLKKTSMMLKKAFFLLAILAVLAYFFVPKIVLDFMESVSITGIEEFDNSPELKHEAGEIEIISNEEIPSYGEIPTYEEIQITKAKEQDTVNINKEEEIQTIDPDLEETLRKIDEKNKLKRQEEAEREAERYKQMQPSVENFIENIKTTDWYK